ncbi:MAG TPA: O-methyltransferase [Flavisolibacter sp.]|nr:O-methyltransferase [Flavisolibacter sp.]
MDIVNPLAQQYAERYTTAEDGLLAEVAAFTVSNHSKAHMLSGHLQGKLLEMISAMVRPLRILEIGTFTGYSALCLAKGLEPGGLLHTVELRQPDAAAARAFFDRSFYREQIILHIGDALEIVGELDESWDLVFIDADKENYIRYFNLVLPKLKPKGFILADNVLFHGQVLEQEIRGKSAKAIQAFNEYVNARGDVERLLLPVRDGLMILRKC